MVQRLLFWTIRTVRLLAGATAPPRHHTSLCPWWARREWRDSRANMALQESAPPRAEPQRLGKDPGSGESTRGSGEPLPEASQSLQQTDGWQIVEQKKKQRKERKESQHLDKSTKCLMKELPFAKADIQVEFSTSSTPKPNVNKKRKRTTGRQNEEETLITKKKKDPDKPNHFISIPITNTKVMDGIYALQDMIRQKDKRLSEAMVRYGSLHVTLLVMNLSSEDAIEKAVGAFLESKDLIEELLQGKSLELSFQGTDHFNKQVGFVKLTNSDNTATLLKIAEIMKKVFQEKGIFTGDGKAFNPHLTFMKLSKSPNLRKQGVKRIDLTLFEEFKNHHFGNELLNHLDLCSMLKKKQPNGYYYCESSITVGKSHESDVIKEALHKELLAVLSTLNQVKELLSSSEIRMKMYKELLEKWQHLGKSQ